MKARSTSRQTPMLWYLCWSLAAITLTAAHPFLYLRGTRYGYGRNIRPLECVAKGGGKGVCMFAWDCMKANGTHLGTCIDRFYFGSCCKMNNLIPVEVTDASPTSVGGQSTSGQSSEMASDSSSETLSTDKVSVFSSTPANIQTSTTVEPTSGLQDSTSSTLSTDGHILTDVSGSSVEHNSTNGLAQSSVMTTVDIPTSTEDTTSIEDESSIHGETPTDNEGTSIEVSTTDKITEIHGDPTAASVTSSVHPNVIMVDEPGMTLTTPSENDDSLSSTTEVNVAVDPEPMQPEITSPGVTGESSNSGEETSSELPGDLTTTISNLSESPENAQTTLDIVSVTPVSAPATEVPDTGVTGETQTEKTSGSLATITIEEMKTATSTYTPETVSISIDTTSFMTDDSGISKTTVSPSSEIVTTLQQELFTEDSTQSPKPSDMLPPGIFPGHIVPAAITQPPAITTWIPFSSTEVSSISSNISISFPDFDNTIISTSKPAVDVFTVEPEPSSTGMPSIGENEEDTEKLEEDSEKPTVTGPTEASGESDSSESGDTYDMTTDVTPVTTQSPEQELLNRLNTSNYKDICGTPVYPTKRIVGGSEATFGEWPWQVSLRQWRQVTFLHKCGAALLNENWAITAAHCVENVQPDELLLRLGEFDLETSDEPYPFAERKVQIVATHPQFEPRTFEYDLALLRFHEPVNFLPNIIPICIPQDDYSFINDTGYVTGWGRLYEEGPLPSVLQKVPVPVITNEECEAMYRVAGYVEHIPNIFICAGYEAGRRDSCEGDSGGPLVIQREDGTWYLAGVISWGIGCALPNQPGVYTRISEFREWIEKIIVF